MLELSFFEAALYQLVRDRKHPHVYYKGAASAVDFLGLGKEEDGFFHIRSIGFPRYAGPLSDFWSDHPQANRLGSLLTIGHVNSDALGLC